jgi:hypothetical protein
MSGLCYNQRISTYVVSTKHRLDPKCNGYVAVNIGDTLVQINQIPIKPPVAPNLSGESTGVQGNEGEIFIGNNGEIPVTFINPGGAGVNQKVMIIEKYYV